MPDGRKTCKVGRLAAEVGACVRSSRILPTRNTEEKTTKPPFRSNSARWKTRNASACVVDENVKPATTASTALARAFTVVHPLDCIAMVNTVTVPHIKVTNQVAGVGCMTPVLGQASTILTICITPSLILAGWVMGLRSRSGILVGGGRGGRAMVFVFTLYHVGPVNIRFIPTFQLVYFDSLHPSRPDLSYAS
jgi:hypothetical protein